MKFFQKGAVRQQLGLAGQRSERVLRIDQVPAQAAQTVLRTATKVIDSMADKKVVHKNNAARNKSRLAAAIKAMA